MTNQKPRSEWRLFAPPLTSWFLCPNPKAQTPVGRTALKKCGSPAPHSFTAIS